MSMEARDNLTMDQKAGVSEQDTDAISLTGVKFSAGLLIALGCVWALYAVLGLVIAGVGAIRLWGQRSLSYSDVRMLLATIAFELIMGALTWLCIKAAKALRDARRWGAYVAMVFGFFLLLIPALFTYDMYHPERQSVDEGDGMVLIPFILFVGLWWCIYLNLPHVRAHLRRTQVG